MIETHSYRPFVIHERTLVNLKFVLRIYIGMTLATGIAAIFIPASYILYIVPIVLWSFLLIQVQTVLPLRYFSWFVWTRTTVELRKIENLVNINQWLIETLPFGSYLRVITDIESNSLKYCFKNKSDAVMVKLIWG